MSFLVTGGKGFIGARVIHTLVALGEKVVCLEPRATGGRLADILDQVTMVAGDVAQMESVLSTIQDHGVTSIAHTVYMHTSPLPGEMHREMSVMVQGTANVFEAARRLGVKRVIFPSSIAYYGPQWLHGERQLKEDDPSLAQSIYGVSKRLIEVLAQEYNRHFEMEIVSLRISVAYGPGGRVGSRGVNLIATEGGLGRPVVFPHPPDDRVLLCHVEDVAGVMLHLLQADRVVHQVYNMGGVTFSFQELADLAQELQPDVQVTFNRESRIDLPYLVNGDRLQSEIGSMHRDPRNAYRELMDQARREAGLPLLP